MPRDKTVNHEKIVEAAFDEFRKYGFEDASMRRIASACGMSASGLYKHFPGKEEMFTSLIKPALDGLMNLYHQIEDEYFDDLSKNKIADVSDSKGELVRAMEFIYDHYDEFAWIPFDCPERVSCVLCTHAGEKNEKVLEFVKVLQKIYRENPDFKA